MAGISMKVVALAALSVVPCLFACPLQAWSQQTTVGNGTVMAPTSGELEPYGVKSPEVSSQSEFSTRHFRRGNSSGIGGSFLQTTSPTSESSPAVHQIDQQAVRTSQIRLPNLESSVTPNAYSPALDIFTPALPHTPRSSALSAPTASPAQFNSNNSGLEDLPSFSRNQSFMDKMKF